jgi:GR25 family glycosyltransferase involved in LPS biosynthesis
MNNLKYIHLEGYEFLPNKDSVGHDIEYINSNGQNYLNYLTALKSRADVNPSCMAFNTYGYLKYDFTSLDSFIILRNINNEGYYDGFYVKKEHLIKLNKSQQEKQQVGQQFNLLNSPKNVIQNNSTIRNHFRDKYVVKLLCDFDMNLAPRWDFMNPRDNDLHFISDKTSKADYYVIINHVGFSEYYEPEKTFVFNMEPSSHFINNKSKLPDESKILKYMNHKNGYNNVEWHLKKTIFELRDEQIEKTKTLSMILSDYYYHQGHKLRVNFAKYIDNKLNIDIYGRCASLNLKSYKGQLPPLSKNDGTYPYKYSTAVENNSEFNYFTEKLTDCIVSECLCFYWGAPNVSDYYPSEAFIYLDLSDFDKALNQIKTAIENNEWEKRLPAIKEAKRRMLYEMYFAKRIENLIKETNVIQLYDDKIVNFNYEFKESNKSNIRYPCINLLRRQDRKKKVAEDLEPVGIYTYDFFEAIDGRQLHKSKNLMKLLCGNDFTDSSTVTGCALSHISLWLDLLKDEDHNVYCIFEDDVVFKDNFTTFYPQTLLWSESNDWDVIYLGVTHFGQWNIHVHETELSIEPIIKDKRKVHTFGAQSYLINKRGAKIIVDYIKKYGLTQGIDVFINYAIDDFKVFEVVPHLTYQSIDVTRNYQTSDSDIRGHPKLLD